MLSAERFQFETPNAIDAGEAPPTRPTRSLPSTEGTSSNVNEASETRSTKRGVVAPPQSRFAETIKIQIGEQDMPTESEDAYDRWEDEARDPSNDMVPSIEEARLYAAAVLSESSRSGSFRIPTQPLTSRRRRKNVLTRAAKVRRDAEYRWAFRVFCNSLLIIVAITMVYLVFFTNKFTDTEQYSARRQETISFLSSSVSDWSELVKEGTPQFKAAQWIADVDELAYNVPNVDDPDQHRFVQRYILAVLYFALGGKDWNNSLLFLSDEDECAWFQARKADDGQEYAIGVTCGGTDLHVKDLYMPHNNLVGAIPKEIQFLSELELLSFSRNSITGSLPQSLSKLSMLQYLDLSRNHLAGTFDVDIHRLERLQVLNLGHNDFYGPIPSNWNSLTNLVTLGLESNALMGKLSDVVGKLTNLEYLYAGNNLFEEAIDSLFFSSLAQLRELDLSQNKLRGELSLQTLLEHPRLNMVDLSQNAFNGKFPDHIQEVNLALKFLALDSNEFTGTIPPSIENLIQLTSLDLQNNGFTGTIPDSIANLNLEYLALGGNNFASQEFPTSFFHLSNLKELSIANANLTGTIPASLASLSNLEFLDLGENAFNGTIPNDVWEMPYLSFLFLHFNDLTGSIPQDIEVSADLEVLALHGNALYGDVDDLCAEASNLQVFTYDCDQVSCSSDCCHGCCESSQSEQCFDDLLSTILSNGDRLSEYFYKRSEYALSPNILSAGQ